MPHIENSDKEMYDYALNKLSNEVNSRPVGHLVYVLYVLTLRWMRSIDYGMIPNFERRLIALGALNETQHELRRLHLADYENAKINDNGEAL